MRPLVVKFGGELIEDRAYLAAAVAGLSAIARAGAPLVVVHGGGKEIDAALKVAGIDKRQVEGLRITDEATLDVVVSVLAGAVNTRFVAALNTAGVPAVGLTGADASCGLSAAAPPHQTVDGDVVDLGCVGVPDDGADMQLLHTLTAGRFVPVIACIGLGAIFEATIFCLAKFDEVDFCNQSLGAVFAAGTALLLVDHQKPPPQWMDIGLIVGIIFLGAGGVYAVA